MKTTLQLISELNTKRDGWLTQAYSTQSFSNDPNHSRGVADGILIAIAAIKESCAAPGATPVVPPLMKLALALSARATDINCGHVHKNEDAARRRSMVVIYKELAEIILEALK